MKVLFTSIWHQYHVMSYDSPFYSFNRYLLSIIKANHCSKQQEHIVKKIGILVFLRMAICIILSYDIMKSCDP